MRLTGPSKDQTRNYASVSQLPSQQVAILSGTRRADNQKGTAAMSEDRPADDTGEGVESAVGLSPEALVDLVRLLAMRDDATAKLMRYG